MDISQITKDLVDNMREQTIRSYREFYGTNLDPLRVKGNIRNRLHSFLKELERQPEPYVDSKFSQLISEIEKFAEETFGAPLLQWYRDSVPEVLAIKKADSYHTFRLLELSWIQHKTQLQELINRIDTYGLHLDIQKRESVKYARYNVIIQYQPQDSKKN